MNFTCEFSYDRFLELFQKTFFSPRASPLAKLAIERNDCFFPVWSFSHYLESSPSRLSFR